MNPDSGVTANDATYEGFPVCRMIERDEEALTRILHERIAQPVVMMGIVSHEWKERSDESRDL